MLCPMISIDCGSRDLAIQSLSAICGVDRTALERSIREVDTEDDAKWVNDDNERIPYYSYIALVLEKKFGFREDDIGHVYYYHWSRRYQGGNFDEGILPLNKAIVPIWGQLIKMFNYDNTIANRLRDKQIKGDLLACDQFLLDEPHRAGPWAMLADERMDYCQNHYLRELPEIIRDICVWYETEYGESIEGRVKDALRPCVVKFVIPYDEVIKFNPIGGLVSYCAQIVSTYKGRDDESCPNVESYYDGNGRAVPPSRICGVEWIDEIPSRNIPSSTNDAMPKFTQVGNRIYIEWPSSAEL